MVHGEQQHYKLVILVAVFCFLVWVPACIFVVEFGPKFGIECNDFQVAVVRKICQKNEKVQVDVPSHGPFVLLNTWPQTLISWGFMCSEC